MNRERVKKFLTERSAVLPPPSHQEWELSSGSGSSSAATAHVIQHDAWELEMPFSPIKRPAEHAEVSVREKRVRTVIPPSPPPEESLMVVPPSPPPLLPPPFPPMNCSIVLPQKAMQLEVDEMVRRIREPDKRASKNMWVKKSTQEHILLNWETLSHELVYANKLLAQRDEELKFVMEQSVVRHHETTGRHHRLVHGLVDVIQWLMSRSERNEEQARKELCDTIIPQLPSELGGAVKLLCAQPSAPNTPSAPERRILFVLKRQKPRLIYFDPGPRPGAPAPGAPAPGAPTAQMSSKSPTSTSSAMAASTSMATAEV